MTPLLGRHSMEKRLSGSHTTVHEYMLRGEVEKAKNLLLSDPHLGRERAGPELRTPLLTACVMGSPLAEWLISFGGHNCCQQVDDDGRSALHLAAKFGHLHIVESLLRSDGKALLFLQDRKKETALHLACDSGHVDVVDALMSYSPSKAQLAGIENMWGAQALELADKKKKEHIRTVINYHCFAERYSAEFGEPVQPVPVKETDGGMVDNKAFLSLAEDVKQLKEVVKQLQNEIHTKDEALNTLTSLVLDLARRTPSSSLHPSPFKEIASPTSTSNPINVSFDFSLPSPSSSKAPSFSSPVSN